MGNGDSYNVKNIRMQEIKLKDDLKKHFEENINSIIDLCELKTKTLKDLVKKAKVSIDYFEILHHLETNNTLAHASIECPFFAFALPTYREIKEWESLLKNLPIKRKYLKSLFFSESYMPLDIRLLKAKTLIDITEGINTKNNLILLDLDYGIILFERQGRVGNLCLDRGMISRYEIKSSETRWNSEKILDIGIQRGRKFLKERDVDKLEMCEFHVKNKKEIDEIIANISAEIEKDEDCELWFRGQPNEYMLPDLKEEAREGICPYRNVEDISMGPSLYRNFKKQISDKKEYCFKSIEHYEYNIFFNNFLGLSDYTLRYDLDSSVEEKLPESWNDINPGMSSHMYVDGEYVRTTDTHPHFSGLQASLFSQHYGIDSSILDITSNIDVALFFAQNKIKNGEYVKVDWSKNEPVIYLFILNKKLDRFLNSKKLLENHGILRPIRQECGILTGASMISRNYYSRFIAVKIVLKNEIELKPHITSEYLFPGPSEDQFLKKLLEFSEKRKHRRVKPFVLKE